MEKRLLTVGYKITSIDGLENISYSNYTLNFLSEKRWKNKLDKINYKIENNELQSIIIVVSKYLIDEVESLGIKRFKDFIKACQKTNCFVAIQEYLEADAPMYYDYLEDRYLNVEELQEKVDNQKNIKHHPNFNHSDPLSSENNFDISSQGVKSEYERKLELLKETERIFPKAKKVIKLLKKNFEEIITFKYLSQVYDFVKSELIENFSNEILNIYIPRQYGFKFEFDDFIQLFEKYLKSVEQLNVSVEINETSKGVNYKFISNDMIESISDLPNKFKRFTDFIDICEKEPEHAIHLLESKNIASSQALEIIQRLSKKYKRLTLDIKQQQERLELTYKQEVQSELLEFGYSETPFSLVENRFSVESFNTIYIPNNEEKEFIRLVQNHKSELDITNVKSDLGILNDQEIKPDDRKRSAYKLKKILTKILNKGIEHSEKIAVDVLVAYINSKVV